MDGNSTGATAVRTFIIRNMYHLSIKFEYAGVVAVVWMILIFPQLIEYSKMHFFRNLRHTNFVRIWPYSVRFIPTLFPQFN